MHMWLIFHNHRHADGLRLWRKPHVCPWPSAHLEELSCAFLATYSAIWCIGDHWNLGTSFTNITRYYAMSK